MQKIIRVPENYYKKVVIWASNIANLRLLYRCVMFDVTLYEINLKSLRCILKMIYNWDIGLSFCLLHYGELIRSRG